PMLANFAINLLTIPASNAYCERKISELGDTLGMRQLEIKLELLDTLQCLECWR
ncbi:hypothetical protein COCCADRAFT_72055, partial [Bipolaris zeicola 26-R-13]